MKGDKNAHFTKCLMLWHRRQNRREMPWKGEKDPYRIWLSEIILQQTRVEQGWDYYNRFVNQYPTIVQLANAPDQEVFKLWEGLGYYSRCRNLLATARLVRDQYGGHFPHTYDEILSLKGVGPYTAAAIASFAYNLPFAVTDGNVMRVLARYFGIKTDILSTKGKKQFADLSQSLLPAGRSAEFNQAIMDFGATVCKPALPLCKDCPLSGQCTAYGEGRTAQYPVKAKKAARKKRFMYYIILEYRGKIAVRLREQKDIWRHLNEFVLIELEKKSIPGAIVRSDAFRNLVGADADIVYTSPVITQALTHQQIEGLFIHVKANRSLLPEGYRWISKGSMAELPFPRFINQFIQGYHI